MNINVHIERLILDGLPITQGQGAIVQAAVEAELARLIAAGELKTDLLQGGARPYASADAIQLASDNSPTRLGQQIARSVYVSIGRSEGQPSDGVKR